jgi:3-hydroxyisobutyrate dehydrogenase-like beta-hydroxyacid dehydrogenase
VETVGLIGLGLMGGELAGRFRVGGLRVVGYDLRDECRQRLAELGGEPAGSVREVFAAARLVVFSLPNSDAVAGVIGEAGELVRGASIIDTTTGDPDATAALGERLAAAGAGYLDATLTGSSRVARAGELVVTAGGQAEEFRHAEPLFRLIARKWCHVGPWGSGARTKLVVNLVLGLNRAVLAEGLAFARRCGLDLPAVLVVLRSGAAYSAVMDAKGGKMIAADFATEARLAQHLKDVRLILAAGAKVEAALPLSELHERLLADLVERGLGECDNSSVIRAFDAEGGAA